MNIRPATEADAAAISRLIVEVSQAYVLGDYVEEGQRNYLRTVDPVSISTYIRSSFQYFVAEEGQKLLGVISIRDRRHLYHLFVDGAHQQQGIARQLWDYARSEVMISGTPAVFTVNSSPGAVAIYQKMGFFATGPAVEKSGVISTPMEIRLNIPVDLPDLVIETDRISMVPISAEFRTEIFHEFSPDVTKYMYPASPTDISMTDAFIESAVTSLRSNDDYQVVVLNRMTGEFLGCSGMHRIFRLHPELGIWIKASAHGNGYGQEAVFALKAWADEHLDYEYLVYPVDRRNGASVRIPEKLGGAVGRTYEIRNLSGNQLEISEYRIFPDR